MIRRPPPLPPHRRHRRRAPPPQLISRFRPPSRARSPSPPTTAPGTIQDVEHVVCLMQENRSFDHYFGSMAGVRGFADPFPIPVPDTNLLKGRTVWYQRNDTATGSNPKVLAPQHNDTSVNFALIRTVGHACTCIPTRKLAWDHGRLVELAAVQEQQPVDGVLHAARHPVPVRARQRRSRSATTTTRRSPAAPTRTAASSTPAPTTARTTRASRASSTARRWTTATTR